jgi:hypothetical protein
MYLVKNQSHREIKKSQKLYSDKIVIEKSDLQLAVINKVLELD